MYMTAVTSSVRGDRHPPPAIALQDPPDTASRHIIQNVYVFTMFKMTVLQAQPEEEMDHIRDGPDCIEFEPPTERHETAV